ncbi:cupin domain-containing protein [Bacillus piscicola]|uniref:cupin domain-containing protein n=1 Tax=Bacillus piscicola TaxID=1632684 RepID=UPI001F091AE6|nr:cupin domain-containing protein [Bacillus piscicola]
MNYHSYMYPYPYAYYPRVPVYNHGNMGAPGYWNMAVEPSHATSFSPFPNNRSYTDTGLKDHGKTPYVVDINQAAKQNNTFRTAIWSGYHLQVTLMSINVGEDIGLEVHPDLDQFLRIEEGQGLVQMGSKESVDFLRHVDDDSAIMVPAGTWHNITNTGNTPLKLYSIYAPPEHPFGTVHQTKAEAVAAEKSRD